MAPVALKEGGFSQMRLQIDKYGENSGQDQLAKDVIWCTAKLSWK